MKRNFLKVAILSFVACCCGLSVATAQLLSSAVNQMDIVGEQMAILQDATERAEYIEALTAYKKALEALKEVWTGLQELYQRNADKFLFFDKMRAPIKKIQNKHRYQVLMRLSDTSILPQIYDACAAARSRDALVSVEENPTNLS